MSTSPSTSSWSTLTTRIVIAGAAATVVGFLVWQWRRGSSLQQEQELSTTPSNSSGTVAASNAEAINPTAAVSDEQLVEALRQRNISGESVELLLKQTRNHNDPAEQAQKNAQLAALKMATTTTKETRKNNDKAAAESGKDVPHSPMMRIETAPPSPSDKQPQQNQSIAAAAAAAAAAPASVAPAGENEDLLKLQEMLARRYSEFFLVGGSQYTQKQSNLYVTLRIQHSYNTQQQQQGQQSSKSAARSSHSSAGATEVVSGENLPRHLNTGTNITRTISGDAGTGKTVLAQYLACTQRATNALIVFVPLRDLRGVQVDTATKLLEVALGPMVQSQSVRARILEQKIIWLLDGLDEVLLAAEQEQESSLAFFLNNFVDPRQRQYNAEDGELVDLVRPQDQIIITSREERGLYSSSMKKVRVNIDAGRVDRWQLQRWEPAEVEQYCQTFFQMGTFFSEWTAEEVERAIASAIETCLSPEMQHWRGLPLFCNMICELQASKRSPPYQKNSSSAPLATPSQIYTDVFFLFWQRASSRVLSFLKKMKKEQLLGTGDAISGMERLANFCLNAASTKSFDQLCLQGATLASVRRPSNSSSNGVVSSSDSSSNGLVSSSDSSGNVSGMMTSNSSSGKSSGIAIDEVASLVFDEGSPPPVWVRLLQITGLLREVHPNSNVMRFPHRSFIEYLSARHVASTFDQPLPRPTLQRVAERMASVTMISAATTTATSSSRPLLLPSNLTALDLLPFNSKFVTVWILLADSIRTCKSERPLLAECVAEKVMWAARDWLVDFAASSTNQAVAASANVGGGGGAPQQQQQQQQLRISFDDLRPVLDVFEQDLSLRGFMRCAASAGNDGAAVPLFLEKILTFLLPEEDDGSSMSRSSSTVCPFLVLDVHESGYVLDIRGLLLLRLFTAAAKEGLVGALEWFFDKHNEILALQCEAILERGGENFASRCSAALVLSLDCPQAGKALKWLADRASDSLDLGVAVRCQSLVGTHVAARAQLKKKKMQQQQDADKPQLTVESEQFQSRLAEAVSSRNFDIVAALLPLAPTWEKRLFHEQAMSWFWHCVLPRELRTVEFFGGEAEREQTRIVVKSREELARENGIPVPQTTTTTTAADGKVEEVELTFYLFGALETLPNTARFAARIPDLIASLLCLPNLIRVMDQPTSDRRALGLPLAERFVRVRGPRYPDTISGSCLEHAQLLDNVLLHDFDKLIIEALTSQHLRHFFVPSSWFVSFNAVLETVQQNALHLETFQITLDVGLSSRDDSWDERSRAQRACALAALEKFTRRCGKSLRSFRIGFATGIGAVTDSYTEKAARKVASSKLTEEELRGVLCHLPHLKVLWCGHLSDESSKAVADCCPQLEELHAREVRRLNHHGLSAALLSKQVTDTTLEVLATAPLRRTLRVLDVARSRVTVDGVRTLARQMPQLEVLSLRRSVANEAANLDALFELMEEDGVFPNMKLLDLEAGEEETLQGYVDDDSESDTEERRRFHPGGYMAI